MKDLSHTGAPHMPDDFQFDVFLSHSAKDKAVVWPLAEWLRNDGLKVWFDEWVLKPGDNIPAKIEEGLERSRVLVLRCRKLCSRDKKLNTRHRFQ